MSSETTPFTASTPTTSSKEASPYPDFETLRSSKIYKLVQNGKDYYQPSWDVDVVYTGTDRLMYGYMKKDYISLSEEVIATTLRIDSKAHETICKKYSGGDIKMPGVDNNRTVGVYEVQTKEEYSEPKEPPKRVSVESIAGMELFLDVPTSTYVVVKGKEEFPATLESFRNIVDGLSVVQKLKIDVEKEIAEEQEIVRLGQRILLIGPTGSGKTMSFHKATEALTKLGKLDYIEKITITEGFEDTDFLAYIHPNATGGLDIKEKNIVDIFRQASKGKKIAICLDELNRGSRSFMNFILTMLDGVDGENYVLNNFMNDEKIVIPTENVLIYATMNMGSKYTGTSVIDEALLDRFNQVNYVTYNEESEKVIADTAFEEHSEKVIVLVKRIRELAKDGSIRSAISTRGLINWAEAFVNTLKTESDLYNTFTSTLMYRLVNIDDSGAPQKDELLLIMKSMKDAGIPIS